MHLYSQLLPLQEKHERIIWPVCIAVWWLFGPRNLKHNYHPLTPATWNWWGGLQVHMLSVRVSVQFSRSVVSDSLWPRGLQHARPPYHQLLQLAQTHIHWVSDAIQQSHPVIPFSHLQSFPANKSGSQSTGVSASALVLPMNIQDWLPLGLTGWISLQSKGLSRVFSNTTVLKHQFFGAQLSLWSNSHIHTWLLEIP